MVPSGAMAGAVLTGGRCEPQVTVGVGAGCPSAPRTGQGRSAFAYRQKHCSFGAGVPGTSDDQGTGVAMPPAVTFTSQDCGTSTSHGSFADPSSCMTL